MSKHLIESFLARQIRRHRTPSIQYIFFNANTSIYEFRKGMADVKNHTEVSAQSAYPIFSITKTFTALAVLQLEASGKLDIGDPVSWYLSDFPYSSVITIRQLLSHAAGIPSPVPLGWIHMAIDHDTFNAKDFFKTIFDQNMSIRSGPNEKFKYSNLGFVFLGDLIEKVSGVAYEQYLAQNIFRKLNLDEKEIGFRLYPGDDHVTGYQKKNSFLRLLLPLFIDTHKYMAEAEGAWKPFRDFYVNGSAYGGVIATAKSLVVYLQDLLKPDSSLLNHESKSKLFKENILKNREPSGMCLSWVKGNLNGKAYYAHAGGGGGFYSEIRLYPKERVGSVILFNRTGVRDERFLDSVDRLIL